MDGIGKRLHRRRSWRIGCLALAFVLMGCSRDQDYLDVVKEQQAAWREMTEILKTVKDAPTMAEAQKTLNANAERYAAISRKAQALPKPPPANVIERLKEDEYFMQATIKYLRAETKRVSELPGGAEFLKKFESTQGLLSAIEQ